MNSLSTLLGKRPFQLPERQTEQHNKSQKSDCIIPGLIPDVVLEIVSKMDFETLVNFHATCKEAEDYTYKRWKHFKGEHGYNFSFGITKMLSLRDQYIYCHLVRKTMDINYGMARVKDGRLLCTSSIILFASKRPNSDLRYYPDYTKESTERIDEYAKEHTGECILKILHIIPSLETKKKLFPLYEQAVTKGMTRASLYAFKAGTLTKDIEELKIVKNTVLKAAEQGDFNALELAIRSDPTSYFDDCSNTYPPYFGYKGDLAMQQKDFSGAFALYTRALDMYKKQQPITGYYYAQLAIACQNLNRAVDALKYYETFSRLASNIPLEFSKFTTDLIARKKEFFYQAANKLFEEKNFEGALDLYRSFGEPVETRAIVHCAYAHYMLGNFQGAVMNSSIFENKALPKELVGLLEEIVQGVNNEFKKANRLASEGNFKEAIDSYEILRASFFGGHRRRVEARLIMTYYNAGMKTAALDLLSDFNYDRHNLPHSSPSDEEMHVEQFFKDRLPEFIEKAKRLIEEEKYEKSNLIHLSICSLINQNFYLPNKEVQGIIAARMSYCCYKTGEFEQAVNLLDGLEIETLPAEDSRLLQQMQADSTFQLHFKRFEANDLIETFDINKI